MTVIHLFCFALSQVKNETLLFSDPALDLTDDVTSMLDVAASEASSQSD